MMEEDDDIGWARLGRFVRMCRLRRGRSEAEIVQRSRVWGVTLTVDDIQEIEGGSCPIELESLTAIAGVCLMDVRDFQSFAGLASRCHLDPTEVDPAVLRPLGVSAFRSGALYDAFAYFERALELIEAPAPGEPQSRLERTLRVDLGAAARRLGHHRIADEYLQSIDLDGPEDEDVRAHGHLLLAITMRGLGRYEGLEEDRLELAEQLTESAGYGYLTPAIESFQAGSVQLNGELSEAIAEYERLTDEYERRREAAAALILQGTWASALLQADDVEAGLTLHAETFASAGEQRDPWLARLSAVLYGGALYRAGLPEDAEQVLLGMLPEIEQRQYPEIDFLLGYYLRRISIDAERWTSALELSHMTYWCSREVQSMSSELAHFREECRLLGADFEDVIDLAMSGEAAEPAEPSPRPPGLRLVEPPGEPATPKLNMDLVRTIVEAHERASRSASRHPREPRTPDPIVPTLSLVR